MLREILKEYDIKSNMNEISKNAINVKWFIKTNELWNGEFTINDKEFHIIIEIKNIKINNNECKYAYLKFDRNDLLDPYILTNDMIKPLVVKNTIIKVLYDFLENNNIDLFIVKRNADEKSMIDKYKNYLDKIKLSFNLHILYDKKYKNYHYIVIMKGKCSKLLKDNNLEKEIIANI